MNATIESVLKTWLTALNTGYTIVTGTDDAVKDPEEILIEAAVRQVDHDVGTLHKAIVTITIEAPSLAASSAQVKTAEATVKSAIDGISTNGLAAAFSGSGLSYGGSFVRNRTSSTENDKFRHSTEIMIGILETG